MYISKEQGQNYGENILVDWPSQFFFCSQAIDHTATQIFSLLHSLQNTYRVPSVHCVKSVFVCVYLHTVQKYLFPTATRNYFQA